MSRWTVILTGLLLAAPVWADDDVKTPSSAPPRFATVMSFDKERQEVILGYVSMHFVLDARMEAREEGGKKVEVEVPVMKSVYEMRPNKFVLRRGAVYDTAGKKVEADALWKRLSVGASVLVSIEGKPVDPSYLSIVKKETLVFAPSLDPANFVPAVHPQKP